MPEAYASAHFEVADFRVSKKIFCTINPEQGRIVLKLDPEDQHNLLDGEAVQRVAGSWGQKGWTYVYLAGLAEERLAALIHLAWATVAPKRLTQASATQSRKNSAQ